MAKTKEELNELKQEYETLNNKLKELSPEELKQVTGGGQSSFKVVVSDVVGKMFSDAKTELTNSGLVVDSKYDNSSKPKDTVLSSEPLSGSLVDNGSKVVLTLSNGRA